MLIFGDARRPETIRTKELKRYDEKEARKPFIPSGTNKKNRLTNPCPQG